MKNLRVFLFLIFFFFLPTLATFGEGSKQLRPDTAYDAHLLITGPTWTECFATSACDDDHKLFVRVSSPSEKIYLGFGTTSLIFRITKNGTVVFGPKTITINSQGYIKYHSQAIAGPNVANVHGYNAIQFAPGSPGDYSIEFNPQPQIGRFDITVIDTATTPLAAIDGRLWAKYWLIETLTGPTVPSDPFLATMFIYSDDSVVTSINFNHMLPSGIQLTANRNGLFPPPVPFDTSRMSRSGQYFYPQYKIFLCNPDVNQFPTGTNGLIQNGVVVTPQCDGSVMLNFSASKPGVVNIEIEINPLPGHQPEDVTLTEPVAAGANTIIWNGMNGLGVAVPSGAVIGINISYVNGLTNVALYSVQSNLNGFIVQLVRPPGPPIAMYWDDIKLSFWGGVTQLDGCYSVLPSTGCHAWDGGNNWGLGWSKTVNSWWYSSSSNLNLGNFTVIRAPEQAANILGSLQPCLYSTESYTVQPDPLPGAAQDRYNWVLSDAGTGTILFDVMNLGTTINIDFSNYPPGQKWLKVRGNSTACGFGPFGPAPNGILINIIQPTQVTNTANTFTICSGEQTDILLQASFPSTSFSYSATATSPLVTGYFPDNINPIHQTLFNSGTEPDSVIYRIVPFATPCYGDTTNFYVIVNPYLPAGVSIVVSSNPVCSGTSVTFTATHTNGGTTPHYQWKVNGTNAGTNSPNFTYIPTDNDMVSCILTSSETCATGNPATSNQAVMTVTPNLPVSISISTPSTSFCTGSSVTITATPANGGTIPSYQWKVNANNAINGNNAVFTYTPVNGDIVTCVLSSSDICVTGNPVTSNTLTLTGITTLPAGITITANPNPFCQGSQVTFTATPVNGGSTPLYQWKVNANNASNGNNAVFTYNPVDNDQVQCILTSDLTCVTGNPAVSGMIIMTGLPAPTVTFLNCFDAVTTINAQPFKLKGGIPLGGAYSGPGVNSTTGIFSPLLAGTGTKTINYSYTNASLCSDSKSQTIIVTPTPVFSCGNILTDIRDNRQYPTVQIGSQCWMQTNLEFGTEIPEFNPQTDNCLVEKYVLTSKFVNQYSIFYQWDELMRYDPTPGAQGLCPPGWHVPTENDWNTLFNFYQGYALAGKPLQYNMISGFMALPGGIFYQNSSWSFLDFATIFWSSTSSGQYRAI
ncbi:MAG: FISUMP domain-containing protein, partial [Bacteroidales bacterium]|nr:FISUMP domain-containing protein [Bacteroidales bacterium]